MDFALRDLASDNLGRFPFVRRSCKCYHPGMKFLSGTVALLACLFIIACSTKNDQITPMQEAREDKYQELWVRDQEGRIQ